MELVGGSLDDVFSGDCDVVKRVGGRGEAEVHRPLAAGHTFCLLCVALKRGQGGTGEGGTGSSCPWRKLSFG